ncbi:hypothetical protein [Acetobacterium malicum]|nr:hypothetical protein [Acetobacterium dehalogenans]
MIPLMNEKWEIKNGIPFQAKGYVSAIARDCLYKGTFDGRPRLQ